MAQRRPRLASQPLKRGKTPEYKYSSSEISSEYRLEDI